MVFARGDGADEWRIDCGGAGHTTCSETVADGTTITLTATPAASFTGFTGGGCGTGGHRFSLFVAVSEARATLGSKKSHPEVEG